MAEKLLQNMKDEMLQAWQAAVNERERQRKSELMKKYQELYRRFRIQRAILNDR